MPFVRKETEKLIEEIYACLQNTPENKEGIEQKGDTTKNHKDENSHKTK